MQGLSNRRTGATSINAESSRSHTVFTCVVESRCKVKTIHVWELMCTNQKKKKKMYENLFGKHK